MRRHYIFIVLIFTFGIGTIQAQKPLSAKEKAELAQKLLKDIDEAQKTVGDLKAQVFMERKEKGKTDLVYELVTYRRAQNNRMMLLFLKPKTEAGKGYLNLGKNLFMYDPTTGKWERQTERERIAGTDSRRRDLDESNLAEEYQAEYIAAEKLGRFDVHHIKLTVRKGYEVAYPIVHLWVDAKTNNPLKEQDHALSGKLMRTIYRPKWDSVYSDVKKGPISFPKEMHIYDEVEKGKNTVIVFLSVVLKPLPGNIFTKAWLESKSR